MKIESSEKNPLEKTKRYYKGREILFFTAIPEEAIQINKKQIEKDRTLTKRVKKKYNKELTYFTQIANRFTFYEVLVNEEWEKPGVTPESPNIITIPVRYIYIYIYNFKGIQKSIPDNRLEQAIDRLFLHERLHSIGDAAKHKNDAGVKLYEEQKQLYRKFIDLNNMKEKAQKGEGLFYWGEEQKLNEETELMFKKTQEYDKKEEEIANRQLMKETPNIDALVSLFMISGLLSEGIIGIKVLLNNVNRLQAGHMDEKFMKVLSYIYPHAHKGKLEVFKKNYIEIGEEIRKKSNL